MKIVIKTISLIFMISVLFASCKAELGNDLDLDINNEVQSRQTGGAYIHILAVGADSYGNKLYRYNELTNSFDIIQGLGTRVEGDYISMDYYGNTTYFGWHINSAGKVYMMKNNGWYEVSGCVAGEISKNWAVGKYDHQIYKFNESTEQFSSIGGSAYSLDASDSGYYVLYTGAGGTVYRYNTNTFQTIQVPGIQAIDVGLRSIYSAYAVDSNNTLKKYNYYTNSFEAFPSNHWAVDDAVRVDVDLYGTVWIVTTWGSIYRFNSSTGDFEYVPVEGYPDLQDIGA